MENFYNDWLKHRTFWFNQFDGFDKYISINYGHLIDDYDYKTNGNPIIGILIYDQLTRHYYRKESANHIITYFNRKALAIALENKNHISSLNYDDWCFYILVYRHTNEKNLLLFAMEEAQKRGKKTFIKATYMRANFKETLDVFDCKNDYYSYLTFDSSILDVWNDNLNYNQDSMAIIGDYSGLLKSKSKKIILSLSGGVDSISCLFSMVQLLGSDGFVAININYNNRDESQEEVRFLIWICNKLKVKLYIRTITEIKRQWAINYDMREVYETYTKRVRFNSYRRVHELENPDNKDFPSVVLGHNYDDCIENILTNIAYKNKCDNLNGIEISMMIDNIHFYRPMIQINKKDIYQFANKNNLSYLKNSTPDWCQRGKIRTNVIPVLEQWDTRFIEGLTNMTSVLKDLHLNLYMTINNNFNFEDEIEIVKLNTSFLYWKYGIFKLFNFYPSNKSLNSLIERLESFLNSYSKRDINKKTKIIINKCLYLSIWKSKKPHYLAYKFIIFDNKNNYDNSYDENVY